jgi:hypothetical protein
LFVACVAALLLMNQPRSDLPPQDMGRLWSDPWFLWGFAHFSLLLMPAALLIVVDGLRRRTRAWWLVGPYLALGIFALAPYLALRPEREDDAALPPWVERALRGRWFWILCAVGSVAAPAVLLPMGSWAGLQETMRYAFGWWFMAADIALNHVCVLPLVQADMRRCGMAAERQRRWLWAIGLTGPLALNAYLAARATFETKVLYPAS